LSRILFDAFDAGAAPVVPPSGPTGTLLAAGIDPEVGSTHTVEYWTDIHKSWSGLERRTRNLSKPRDKLSMTVFVDDETVFRALRSQRAFDPVNVYLIPMRHEGVAARGTFASTSIDIDVTHVDWNTVGQRVYVESPAGSYAGVIQTAPAGPGFVTISLDVAPPASMPDGATIVMPIRPFYLESPSPVGRYAVGAGQWQVIARGHSPVATIGTGGVVNTFDGLPILDVAPLSEGLGGEDRPEGQVELIDYNAKITVEWSRTAADIYRSHLYRVRGHVDRQYFRKLLELVAGRQKPLILPTWRYDFAASSSVGSTVTLNDGGDYTARWFTSLAHRRVRLFDASGAFVDRTVVSATGTSASVITVNTAHGLTVTDVMLLEQVRIASDSIDFTYSTGAQGVVALNFLVVQQ